MKKSVKYNIFCFVIGGLFFGTIGVGASIFYNAEQINYMNVDNINTDVDAALNDLYSIKNELNDTKKIGNATAGNITAGMTAFVKGKIITGTGADITASYQKGYDAGVESAGGVPSNVAKDVNGNAATTNYYGPRLSGVTRQFTMPKGKYLLNIYSTFTQSYYGGDSSSSASVSGADITKINNYCYVVEVTTDTATISISFNSGGYGNSEDSRTMYAITFLQ